MRREAPQGPAARRQGARNARHVYHGWQNGNCGHRKGYGALGRIFGCSEWTARDIVTYRTRIGV